MSPPETRPETSKTQGKTKRVRQYGLAVAVLLVVATILLVWPGLHKPPLTLAKPKADSQLDPQLADFISKELAQLGSSSRRHQDHSRIGLIYAVNGLWEEAQHAFSNACELTSNQPLPRLYLGVSAQELHQLDQAIQHFRGVVQRFPDFMPGYYRLGFALLSSGNAAEAERVFLTLSSRSPGEWRGFAGLGESRIRLGRFKEALEPLKAALQLDPENGGVHALLAQVYRSNGELEDASIHALLGQLSTATPMPDEWNRQGPSLMKLLPDQIQLANDLAAEGNPMEAVRILAGAREFHERNVLLLNQLAIALNRSGQPNKASRIIEDALKIEPKSIPALVTLSMVRNAQNRSQDAVIAADQAIALAPNLAQPLIAKANALLSLEQDEEAIASLEKAAGVDPKNLEIPVEIGDILWRNLQRPEEAKTRYEAALQKSPVSFKALARLFEFSIEQGQMNEAQNYLEQLRRIHPKATEAAGFERHFRPPAKP